MISLYRQFLNESYPKNPNEIIIKNQFYPSGLTEEEIYNYYIKNKQNILQNTENREVMFTIFTDTNTPIIKRKRNNTFILLNNQNYEELITGRTVSIHNTMRKKENIGVIDIDYHDFNICKEVANELYEFLNSVEIRFSGKTSFHIIKHYNQKKDINQIRKELEESLSNQFRNKYLVNSTRSRNKPNLDLSSNKFRGGFICPGSLSLIGLKCMKVNRLSTFRKDDAKIR